MDPRYHDLFIKLKGTDDEIVFTRGITHDELYTIIETINRLNECHRAFKHKTIIEYIKIE